MPLKPHGRIYDSIADTVAGTPLVRINRLIPEGQATVLAKCEFFNPLASVKDRIGYNMISVAEEAGKITPGKSVIIEPTSGNTGIALAFMCAAKGYRCILTMPESMSIERRRLLAALGAELVLPEAAQGMKGAIAQAQAGECLDCELSGVDFAGQNLKEAKLNRSDLRNAKLAGADLGNALMDSVDLQNADLSNANLVQTALTSANLTGANFKGADLSGAYLRGANLADTDFTDANLTGANLANTNLADAVLDGATLDDALLPEDFKAPGL